MGSRSIHQDKREAHPRQGAAYRVDELCWRVPSPFGNVHQMRVLIACEYSGRTREAFRLRGFDAWSCDLLPSEDESKYHIQGDCLQLVGEGWDLMICHPPCTYLAASGLHWNKRVPGRQEKTEESLGFVRALLSSPVRHIALENPIGCIGTKIRKPEQIIQPYQFGDDASKATCLWLKNLPPLRPTAFVEPRMVDGRPRWGNQTDSGQNKLVPSDDRWKERSRTYAGISAAMADQWGGWIRRMAA